MHITHACSHTHIFPPIHVHVPTCTFALTHAHTSTHMHTDTCSHAYIHIHTFTCTHTHKYTPIKHFMSLGNFSEDFGATGRCYISQLPTVCEFPLPMLCLLSISSLHSSSTAPPQRQNCVPMFCIAILLPTVELGTAHTCV